MNLSLVEILEVENQFLKSENEKLAKQVKLLKSKCKVLLLRNNDYTLNEQINDTINLIDKQLAGIK
jgi:hypothetical protein